MDFGINKSPEEVMKEGALGGTYFRDIYSSVNGKWYKNSWREFNFLKNIDKKYYASNFYDTRVNKYGVKCGTLLRFWENKGWIKSIDPYGCFQWYHRYYYGRRSNDDKRQIKRFRGIVSRFKGILVKIIKDKSAKIGDYSAGAKIRQILLYWGYELKIKNLVK